MDAGGGGSTSVGNNRGESQRHTTASRRTCSWTKGSAKKVCHNADKIRKQNALRLRCYEFRIIGGGYIHTFAVKVPRMGTHV